MMIDFYRDIESCKCCDLCYNQPPLVQKTSSADVFWVGLSAVRTDDKNDTPLSQRTNSGKLIEQIEGYVRNIKFHKTNLVKCLPVDAKDKIRYPSTTEMRACYSNIESEINELNPNVIVLLGKQVASYVLRKNGVTDFDLSPDFLYKTITVNSIVFLPVHHPSYIMVYKRKRVAEYSNGISNLLKNVLES